MKIKMTFYKLIKAGFALGIGITAGTLVFKLILKVGVMAILPML